MAKDKMRWIVAKTSDFDEKSLEQLLNDHVGMLVHQIILDPDKGYIVVFGVRVPHGE